MTAHAEPTPPKVGDGATRTLYTDSTACTVIRVSKSGKTAWIQEDKATLLNGPDSGEPDALKFYPGGFAGHMEGRQRYQYEPNPNGRVIRCSRRVLKNGRVIWKVAGTKATERGNDVRFGVRAHHYDYNF